MIPAVLMTNVVHLSEIVAGVSAKHIDCLHFLGEIVLRKPSLARRGAPVATNI